MRTLLSLGLTCLAAVAWADAPQAQVPAAADQIPGYSATVLPCTIRVDEEGFKVRQQGDKTVSVPMVECKGKLLEGKSLRELSILRNTIYARYGWDGFRKSWLRDHFHAQPWFKPNPHFTYKLLSDIDRKNAHIIGTYEQSLSDRELGRMADDVYARRGKVWNDRPLWRKKDGKEVRSCDEPKGGGEYQGEEGDESRDCRYQKKPWYQPNPKFNEDLLTVEDRVELGLISRARGEFAVDGERREDKEGTLEQLLKVKDLRALSLRDLRVLRNTIYARRGRPFKSKILQEHFARMPWYKIDPGYSDKLLSATDQRNITLIKSVENEFGGPLRDEDWLIEPAVDGA